MDISDLVAAVKNRARRARHAIGRVRRVLSQPEGRAQLLAQLRTWGWWQRLTGATADDGWDASDLRRLTVDLPATVSDVVLILRAGGGAVAIAVANDFARVVPDATVHLLPVRRVAAAKRARLLPNVAYRNCATMAELVDYLSARPQPHIVIERSNNPRRASRCFRLVFPFVAPGGVYVAEPVAMRRPDEQVSEGNSIGDLLGTLQALHSGATADGMHYRTVELARAASKIEVRGDAAIVAKKVSYQFKVRDRSADALLAARFGSTWGRLIDTRPAFRWEGHTTVSVHGEGPERARRPVFDVPERYLRRYQDVDCWPLQRLRFGDYWLPDTFRHPLHRYLSHRRLLSVSPDMARLKGGAPGPTRSADGPFFYFDTEYPGHFGHVLTEVVGRYWGWQAARAMAPEIRPLVSLSRGQSGLPDFQRAVFTALGIDVDEFEYVRHDECLTVGTLYAATSDLVMPQYVVPELREVWETIRRGCEQAEPGPTPERLFIARTPRPIRTCLNADEVEALFAGLGFEICYPENHDFGRQVAMFHRAKVIAGFGGSGMFGSMFAPGTTVLTINADTYYAVNEELIKAVVGGDTHYFWGDSLTKHPPGGVTMEAYQSNFTLDVDRFAPEIKDVVDRAVH